MVKRMKKGEYPRSKAWLLEAISVDTARKSRYNENVQYELIRLQGRVQFPTGGYSPQPV